MELRISRFFKDIEDMQGQRVNILYLTTNCNLKCDYCYEKDKPYAPLNLLDAKKFINEIIKREKGMTSTLVIMGGEVFLEWKLLVKVIEYIKTTDHKWGITITTNGTLLTMHSAFDLQSLISPLYKKTLEPANANIHVSYEISYDASGHFRRIFKDNKSSKERVEYNLEYLKKHGIPFKISYTVHKDNYKNLLYDIIYIIEKFIPQRIKLSFAQQELETCGTSHEEIEKLFKPYAEVIYKKYDVPICGISCNVCGRCDKSNFVGNRYFSPTKGLMEEDQKIEKVFNIF